MLQVQNTFASIVAFGTWFILFIFRFLFIHERHTQREAETEAEGEAGSTQGARHGTRSRVSGIMPWAAGGAKPLRHQGCPRGTF